MLAGTVRGVDKPLAQALGAHRSEECLHRQALCHACIQGITDQFAVQSILDTRKLELAFIGGDVGDVCDPSLVRGGDVEWPT